MSPDKTHKKIVDENGTIRKTMTDIPKTKRSRFFKIDYVPGRTVSDKSPDPSPISVSQQADEKKQLLNAMTPDQRKEWHVGSNAQLSANKAASRYSWVDQALENQCNTHWAFGTIGLPSWLTTDEHTINSIFQIRSNAAREIMEVAREHLRRDNLRLTEDVEMILNSVTDDLEPAQARTSKRLLDQHATRHMLAFTEDLSERQERLINHQPTLTEAISMRPDINPKNTAGALPAELLSDDEAPTVRKTPGTATHEGSPPRRRKNRPKKRTRQAAKSSNGAQQTNPKTTPPVGQVSSARPNDARPNATPKTAAATNDPPARRQNPTSLTNYTTNPDRRRDNQNDAPTRDLVAVPKLGIVPAAPVETDSGTTVAMIATAITGRHTPTGVAVAAPRMTIVVKMTDIQLPLSGTRRKTTTGREDQIFGKDSGETGTPAGPPMPTNSLAAPAPYKTTETIADTARTG